MTGTTVMNMPREGQFDACQSRVGVCGYACCQFGKLGNWIYAFPGEVELAQEKGLSFAHLEVEPLDDGGHKVHCMRPCVEGEFKSIDCAIYPAWIASECGTKFLVADNRKCPIPHNELLETLRNAQQVAIDWERKHPGTLAGMAKAAKGFKAYQPFGYAIEWDGTVRQLSDEEVAEITPDELLEPEYIAKFSGVDLDGYTGRGTPEDQPVNTDEMLEPLKGSAEYAFGTSKHLVKADSLKEILDNANLYSRIFLNPFGWRALLQEEELHQQFDLVNSEVDTKLGFLGYALHSEAPGGKVPVFTDAGRPQGFLEFPYMATLREELEFVIKQGGMKGDRVYTAKRRQPAAFARGVTKPVHDKEKAKAARKAQKKARRSGR